jgi:DNA polymerase
MLFIIKYINNHIQVIHMSLMNLKDLIDTCMSCQKCDLASSRKNVAFGEGNLRAKIMLIGEGPGAQEDAQGRPFVGRAGKLLDKMLMEVGLKREEVYIANVVKCRPPGNRVPSQQEADDCLPYLRNQVAIVRPRIIVCLGATAMNYCIDRSYKAIGPIRGKWFDRKGYKLMATYHPAALLRDPKKLDVVMEDFRSMKNLSDSIE